MSREEELSQIIGSNIKIIIERNNLTQKEFADIIGVQESAVGKWILGKNSPRMGTVQRISDQFNVDKSWLMSEHDEDEIIDRDGTFEFVANPTKKFLMDRIAKADGKKLEKIKKLMELIDDEENQNW